MVIYDDIINYCIILYHYHSSITWMPMLGNWRIETCSTMCVWQLRTNKHVKHCGCILRFAFLRHGDRERVWLAPQSDKLKPHIKPNSFWLFLCNHVELKCSMIPKNTSAKPKKPKGLQVSGGSNSTQRWFEFGTCGNTKRTCLESQNSIEQNAERRKERAKGFWSTQHIV